MDQDRKLIGKPWRGNLREVINGANCAQNFVSDLMLCCSADFTDPQISALMAIDIPLGFSLPFINLLTAGITESRVGVSTTNPYLHRQTEFFMFERGLSPLSPLKDMIGSQATKGLHVLNRYGLIRKSCGVWEKNHFLTAIEAYPSASKRSQLMQDLINQIIQQEGADMFPYQDHLDALVCALTGWLFHNKADALIHPPDYIDPIEGWVFAPADGLRL